MDRILTKKEKLITYLKAEKKIRFFLTLIVQRLNRQNSPRFYLFFDQFLNYNFVLISEAKAISFFFLY